MTYKEIQAECQRKHEIFMSLPADTPDLVFDKLENEIDELHELASLAIDAEHDSKIPKIKPRSEWLISFLESFKDCNGRRITTKQAGIFKDCLKFSESVSNYNSYHSKSWVVSVKYEGNYNGRIYTVSVFGNGGYLTIRDIVTI